MAAGEYDITIEQGATFQLTLTWKDSNGNPVNLTNYTARMMVREFYTDAAPLVSLTDQSGITLGGAAGTIAIVITDTATAALSAPKNAKWDIELISGGGVVTRLLRGQATITPEVTK